MNKQEIINYVLNSTINPAILSDLLDDFRSETVMYNITSDESTAQLEPGVTVAQLLADIEEGKTVLLRLQNDKYLLRYTSINNDRITFTYTIAPVASRLYYTNMQVSFSTKTPNEKTSGKYFETIKEL